MLLRAGCGIVVAANVGVAHCQTIVSNGGKPLAMVESGVAEPLVEKVRTKRPGTVVELFVKVGDTVSKDQVLGHTELDQAKLNMDTARQNLEATGSLDQMFWLHRAWTSTREEAEEAVRKRTAPRTRLEYAESMEKWAESQYRAQQDMKKVQKIHYEFYKNEYESRFFRSPVDGVVTEVKVAVGQTVGIAAHAFTISNEAQLSVPVTVPAPAADAAAAAGSVPVREKAGKATIWAKVAGSRDHPGEPGVKKILRLLIPKRDVSAVAGQAKQALRFDVLVPDRPGGKGAAS